MKHQKFSIRKRINSFGYAFNGLKILVREEHNARIHLLSAFFTVIAAILLKVSAIEWVALVLAMGFVITIEIINSAIENIANFISPERHDTIKIIKDLSAAGVLLSAVTALVIGLIIFLPKILFLF